MNNWTKLLGDISSKIKANGNMEITGPVLQSALNDIVKALGRHATYAGIATPFTDPSIEDGPTFYFAVQPGLYLHFDGLILKANEAYILSHTGTPTAMWKATPFTNETARVTAEEARAEAETSRVTAEEARAEAEDARASEFAEMEAAINKFNIIGKPTEQQLEAIEPTLVNEALRKVKQALTPEEQQQVQSNLGITKKDLFVDMWENRCRFNGKDHYFGKYNRETGFFELNEITDIAYEEALQIWALSQHAQLPWNVANIMAPYLFGGVGNIPYMTYGKCRTYFPIISGGGFSATCLINTFTGNNIVETLNFVSGYGNSLSNFPRLNNAFNGCVKLRKILCDITFPTVDDNTFGSCQELEYINITAYINNTTLNFQWSPKLSFESLNLLVTNARFNPNHDPDHTMTLTVKVHPEVYSKLTDETNTEWHALIALAAEKNITFATI